VRRSTCAKSECPSRALLAPSIIPANPPPRMCGHSVPCRPCRVGIHTPKFGSSVVNDNRNLRRAALITEISVDFPHSENPPGHVRQQLQLQRKFRSSPTSPSSFSLAPGPRLRKMLIAAPPVRPAPPIDAALAVSIRQQYISVESKTTCHRHFQNRVVARNPEQFEPSPCARGPP